MSTSSKISIPTTHSLFFYGTLMAPAVLHRVVRGTPNSSSATQDPFNARPALLPQHRRHRVRNADYPAVVPTTATEEASVRGTFVQGLSPNEVRRLDIFEGDEYERRRVRVKLLPFSTPEGGAGGSTPAPADAEAGIPLSSSQSDGDQEEVDAETYVWIAPRSQLEDGEWDFDEFRRDKMWRWAGGQREDIANVDAAAANGALDGEAPQGAAVDGTRGRAFGGEFESKVAGV